MNVAQVSFSILAEVKKTNFQNEFNPFSPLGINE